MGIAGIPTRLMEVINDKYKYLAPAPLPSKHRGMAINAELIRTTHCAPTVEFFLGAFSVTARAK